MRAGEVCDPGEVSGTRDTDRETTAPSTYHQTIPGERDLLILDGSPKTSNSSYITKWMSENNEGITRETRDRAGWRRLIRCAARAADHHS